MLNNVPIIPLPRDAPTFPPRVFPKEPPTDFPRFLPASLPIVPATEFATDFPALFTARFLASSSFSAAL